eukprot:scaffold964_cov261-Pinguiococcus_pyrenoidosus.AAC.27
MACAAFRISGKDLAAHLPMPELCPRRSLDFAAAWGVPVPAEGGWEPLHGHRRLHRRRTP